MDIAKVVSMFLVVFFYLFAGKMIQVFINNEQVIAYGIQIMRAIIIALPFSGIQFLIRVSFQALGKGKPALILALARDLFYIPALFIMNKYWGFYGFIYSQPVSNILIFLLALLLFNNIREQISNEHRKWEIDNSVVIDKISEPIQTEVYLI